MTDGGASYDIELLGFPDADPDRAREQLAAAFRIDVAKAQKLIDRAPIRVKKGTSKREAERYTKALLKIGGDVRVTGPKGDRLYRAAERRDTADRAAVPAATSDIMRSRVPRSLGGRVTCPKCGFEQPEADDCARCGIDFAKFQGQQAANGSNGSNGRRPAPQSAVLSSRRSSSSSSRVYPAVSSSQLMVRSPYVLAAEEDDGLFVSGRRSLDPGEIVRSFSELRSPEGLIGRPPTGSYASPSEAIRGATGVAVEHLRGSADVGFWDKLGPAFRFAIGGAAWQWLIFATLIGSLTFLVLITMARVQVISFIIFGLVVCLCLFSAFLSAQWRFFHMGFADAVEDRNSVPDPISGIDDIKGEFIWPGFMLVLGAIVLWSPFVYVIVDAIETMTAPSPQAVVLTSLLPLIYWPMGMAHVSATSRLTEIFIITEVVKGMVVGGLEYAFVAFLGVAAFSMTWLMGTIGEPTFWLWALLFALLTYASGVQGYLLGRLLRRRPKMIAGTIVVTEDEDPR